MAPRPELEAEHLREKARKEFLNLLEGVSKAEYSHIALEDLTINVGPRKEKHSPQQVLDRSSWSFCQGFYA